MCLVWAGREPHRGGRGDTNQSANLLVMLRIKGYLSVLENIKKRGFLKPGAGAI